MQQQYDLLVIGAGPAGLSAASAAAENGLDVVLLDEQELPGGQIYRSVSGKNSSKNFLSKEDRNDGLELVGRFNKSGALYLPKTTVWDAEPGRVLCSTEGTAREIKAQCIIVATGAMERPVPFPGWTTPGVMSAGSADLLYKSAGMVPPGPVEIAGNGPLIPLVTNHLTELGVEIAGVLDTSPIQNKAISMLHMPQALVDIPFLLKGLKMVVNMFRSGVKQYMGASDIKAEGDGQLKRVTFNHGGKTKTLEAATLLVHEGMLPRTHVSRMLQLEHEWDKTQRYWYAKTDKFGRSSKDSIYVVGDGQKVHGVYAAAAKGELAGLDVARRIKRLCKRAAQLQIKPVEKRLFKALAPRGFVDAFFAPKKGLFNIADNVLVCRCEGVTAGDIRQAVKEGCHDVNEIKLRTRCGMGPCQGRMCGPALAEIAAEALGSEVSNVGALNIRPPIRPITVRELRDFPEAK
jgi:thioredoxin reductase/bacterioferritin-associated ferredoxin